MIMLNGEPNILDHCYTTVKDAYRSVLCPHFGKSDNSAVFLLPAYKQKPKRENLSQKVVQCWSESAEDHLRDCLELVDWTMFKCSVEHLDRYTTIVMDFISKWMEDHVSKRSIHVFPSYKPWMNQEIHSLLKTMRAAFKLEDPDLYRTSRYDLHKAI
eukprot:g20816.t1